MDRVKNGYQTGSLASADRAVDREGAIAGYTTIFLLVITITFGGGGASAFPQFDAVCKFAGFAALAVLISTGSSIKLDANARLWLAFIGLMLFLPVLQLLPFPADFARNLPGRALAEQIRALGPARTTTPLTLDPDATVTSALCLIPGIATFVGTLRMPFIWRRRAIFALLVLAGAALLLGGLQMASGGTTAELYDTPHRLAATGFFANRNHHSQFMLLSLLLAAAVLFEPFRRRDVVLETMRYATLFALATGVLLASSRAGLMLLLFASPAIAILVWGRKVHRRGIILGTLITTAAITFLALNPVARQVIDRFSTTQDARTVFWPDVVFSIRQFWPVGTGLGTFESIFATQERLSTVDEFILNHAHNDYLELALEGGLVAIALTTVFFALFTLRMFQISQRVGELRRFGLTGGVGILLLLAHSTVDYPLRTITLTVVFGFLSGMLFVPAHSAMARDIDAQREVG